MPSLVSVATQIGTESSPAELPLPLPLLLEYPVTGHTGVASAQNGKDGAELFGSVGRPVGAADDEGCAETVGVAVGIEVGGKVGTEVGWLVG